jgi:hypothetical protein
MRAAIFGLILTLVLLAGCASDRKPKEREREPGFFERPDVDSLH